MRRKVMTFEEAVHRQMCRLRRHVMIEKIEQTLDLVIPFVILVLSVLKLTGVITAVEQFTPIVYGALALVEGVFKIWGITIRRKRNGSISN